MDEQDVMSMVKGDLASYISYLVTLLSVDDDRRNRMMKDTQAVKQMRSYVERIDKHLYLCIK